MALISPSDWQKFISAYPQSHILQSEEWGRLKSAFGWQAHYLVNGGCGALILIKKAVAGFSVAYIPKGPVGPQWGLLWPEIDAFCKQSRVVFLKIEPDSLVGDDVNCYLPSTGPLYTSRPIQPRRSVAISLEGSEEDWLERMKQKTRYNIRLAQKKEIEVKTSNNLDEFQSLMETTGQRDGFGVHSRDYYQKAFDLFHSVGKCELLVARYQEKALAAIMVFVQGSRAWYLYGASSDEERQRMPTYLLQWEAMRWAASKGCRSYDLYGIPDEDFETLEAQFSSRSDGLWGVYRFKRGFGGEMIRSVGAWDRVYRPIIYKAYQLINRRREL